MILSTETREHQRESEAIDQLAQPVPVEGPAQGAPEEENQTGGPDALPGEPPETTAVPVQPVQQASLAAEIDSQGEGLVP